MTQDTKVTVETDAALVDEYNATHGTAYVAMPAGACTLSATTLTIQKGQYSATDPVKISLNESSLASLTEKTYLQPLRITQVSGSGKTSEERGIGYIIVNTQEKSIKSISSASEVVGTLLTDYSGCAAWYDTGTDIAVADIFDNNVTNGPQLRADGADGKTQVVIVDMGENN